MNVSRRRIRADYPGMGLTHLCNPGKEGPVEMVAFCPSDRMYHVFARKDAPDETVLHYALLLNDANRNYNGASPHTEISSSRFSAWYPGDIDMEDMVAIVESVPEFKAGWLRPVFENLKIAAGLERNDLPFLNRDFSEHACYFGREGFSEAERSELAFMDVEGARYKGAWISAKGGTLFLSEKTPPALVQKVADEFLPFSSVEFSSKKGLENISWGKSIPLRFVWRSACENPGETKTRMRSLIGDIPQVLKIPEDIVRQEARQIMAERAQKWEQFVASIKLKIS